ncbi:MAG: bifunctional (p)ppGpp synthetase/guanosine-3',5'-bis(diphosphate) 3'-pyrophosphohydrolase [Hyphomicrobium sp.]|nr:bifunctional (p)ppGpp synthetase/guanosine-3',5'-bis(diphosphate) 3'-pyrophosphohydrolase [Hyphomicrobium sp.]
MMRQYELVERVQSYDPKADEALLNRAYVYAMKAHGHQKRASGDPYFSHPLEVAAILTELKLDDATVATALLHDVIEDTDATRAEIDQLFGPEIGALVDGLTKIKRLDLVSKKTEQAENFRKLLIAISTDIRVLLVKLADRLHNMRTLEHMKPESRKRISEETIDIYAPLAGRMGMQALRDELEDHAFRWLNPEAYQTVAAKLTELRDNNGGLVDEIEEALKSKLLAAGIAAEVYGREKKPYSIWSKMSNRQISLEQLSDIYAFRVVVASIDDCYRVLGVVHSTWRAVPGRFKDYISTPKQNNYQSIHTTVVGPRHQRVELQIRTRLMHDVAEYGVAAHSVYKDASNGHGVPSVYDKDSGPYVWLRRLVETLLEGSNPEEFLEHTKLELFQDQVFCFTPKGRLIALPRGATPLDFAYSVHTDVGNSAVGAYVNGRHVPIDTRLRNGDEVEIRTAKGHVPPAAWESLCVTGRAQSAIRRAAREAVRRQYVELGRRLTVAAFEAAGQTYADEQAKRVLSKFQQKSLEEVLAAVARGEILPGDVLKAVAPEAVTQNVAAASNENQLKGWLGLAQFAGLKLKPQVAGQVATGSVQAAAGGISLRGLKDDVPVIFEPGGAVPGDRIVGVLEPGSGIRIFQIHSPRLKEFEHQRWIDMTWDIAPEKHERFPAKLALTGQNKPGALAEIAEVIGQAEGNIDNIKMTRRASDFTEMRIEIEVFDLAHLNRIIGGLKNKRVVEKVERVFE